MLSQEKVLKTLVALGLTQLDARVYIYLAKRGPQKARDIARSLEMPKPTLYLIIKNLESKGIVSFTLEHPARFSAAPFEKVLDLFVKAKMEEAQRLQQSREEILSDWRSVSISETVDTPARFTVIEGRNYIYSRIQQMIQETKTQLSVVSTVPGLVRADQFGLFDAALKHPLKSKIHFRFLTELSDQNLNAVKSLLEENSKSGFNFEGRNPDLGLRLFPQMVIKDEDETIFFIKPGTETFLTEQDSVCLWTNCKSLVQAFLGIFEELWRNSTDIQKKVTAIETGKPTPKTCVIRDAETARKTYDEAIGSAKEEVVIMTSSRGLIDSWKRMTLFKGWAERGVSVRIMAPIISENIEAAQQLLKHCAVRHVPASYLGTTIVDGHHLFQFKNPPPEQEEPEATPNFENTFYTNDFEYVERTKTMLNDIWKNASMPSAVTLQSIIRAPTRAAAAGSEGSRYAEYRKMLGWIEETEEGTLTERDVLNKIINAKRIPAKDPEKDLDIMYCSAGMAVIHTPSYFNLPDMIIVARHVDKQSSLGAEDMVAINLWLETPAGCAYVPVATAGDNPLAVAWRKANYAGTPAERNCHLVKKDEIQVRLHGNTLFAGWTVPIRLFPSACTLPPACILFEGYGELKTGVVRTKSPLGRYNIHEFNGFDAFVTFFHPASKYSGPGTDGLLRRDVIMTSYQPSTK